MGRLKESEIALLNAYAYLQVPNKNGQKLGEAILSVRDDEVLHQKVLSQSGGGLSRHATEQIFDNILDNLKLANLKIVRNNMNDRNFANDGIKVLCFQDFSTKEAVFTYRGTAASEWVDNAIGLYQKETPQQLEARAYFETTCEELRLREKGYEITVSGHSKGGNKAMYVAITSPHVDRCVALDGQGFSDEFVDFYAADIKERASKIKLIAADKDYVHALGNVVVPIENISWYKSNKTNIPLIGTALSHCPDAYLNERGNFTERITKQPQLFTTINKITKELMIAPDRQRYLHAGMGMAQIYLGRSNSPIKREKMPSVHEIRSGLKDGMNYLLKKGYRYPLVKIMANPIVAQVLGTVTKITNHMLNKQIDPDRVNQISESIRLIGGKNVAIFEEKNMEGRGFIGTIKEGKIQRLSEVQPLSYTKARFNDCLRYGIDTEECLLEHIADYQKEERELLTAYRAKDELQVLKRCEVNSLKRDTYKHTQRQLEGRIQFLEMAIAEKNSLSGNQETYYKERLDYFRDRIKESDKISSKPFIDKDMYEKEIAEICDDNMGMLALEQQVYYSQIHHQYLQERLEVNQELVCIVDAKQKVKVLRDTTHDLHIRSELETMYSDLQHKEDMLIEKQQQFIAHDHQEAMEKQFDKNVGAKIISSEQLENIDVAYACYQESMSYLAAHESIDQGNEQKLMEIRMQRAKLEELKTAAEIVTQYQDIYGEYQSKMFFKESFREKYNSEVEQYEVSKNKLSEYGIQNKSELDRNIEQLDRAEKQLVGNRGKTQLSAMGKQAELHQKTKKLVGFSSKVKVADKNINKNRAR